MDNQNKEEIKDAVLEVVEPFFGEIKQKLDEHDQEFFSIKQKLSEHDQRFEKNNKEHAEMRNDMLDGFDKVLKGFEDLKIENISNRAAHECFDEKFEDHEVRIDKLELNNE